jgi:hypothetical protein
MSTVLGCAATQAEVRFTRPRVGLYNNLRIGEVRGLGGIELVKDRATRVLPCGRHCTARGQPASEPMRFAFELAW